MDIETVIAIAKTLHSDLSAVAYFVGYDNPYSIAYGRPETAIYEGSSWEEALRNAGWKG